MLRRSDTEDAEQIEIEVSAYRRVIRLRRYQRTCSCGGPIIVTAPAPPELIPKGHYGLSILVEILLDKDFSYRPTERLLASWRLLGLDLAGGTVSYGSKRLEVLLMPIYEALKQRNPRGDFHQGDETRWRVFVALEDKQGYGRWLWVVSGPDTVISLLDASRSHTVRSEPFDPDDLALVSRPSRGEGNKSMAPGRRREMSGNSRGC